MPVRRFRSVEEMNTPVWRRSGDPELFAAIAGVWDRAARLSRRRFRPGVHRFKDIAALEAAADAPTDRPQP